LLVKFPFKGLMAILERYFCETKNKKPDHLFGNPAILTRPVAFRPCLSTGLAFSKIILKKHLK